MRYHDFLLIQSTSCSPQDFLRPMQIGIYKVAETATFSTDIIPDLVCLLLIVATESVLRHKGVWGAEPAQLGDPILESEVRACGVLYTLLHFTSLHFTPSPTHSPLHTSLHHHHTYTHARTHTHTHKDRERHTDTTSPSTHTMLYNNIIIGVFLIVPTQFRHPSPLPPQDVAEKMPSSPGCRKNTHTPG